MQIPSVCSDTPTRLLGTSVSASLVAFSAIKMYTQIAWGGYAILSSSKGTYSSYICILGSKTSTCGTKAETFLQLLYIALASQTLQGCAAEKGQS